MPARKPKGVPHLQRYHEALKRIEVDLSNGRLEIGDMEECADALFDRLSEQEEEIKRLRDTVRKLLRKAKS